MDFSSETAPGLYFRKKMDKAPQTVSLDADMIRLLIVIDEHKSLYQIAAEVEMDAATFKGPSGLLERAHRNRPQKPHWTRPSFIRAIEPDPGDRADGANRP
jgi:hypothetical protein